MFLVIRGGARWKIGIGIQVAIRNKPWLPNPENPMIQSPLIQGLEKAMVSSLKSLSDPKLG